MTTITVALESAGIAVYEARLLLAKLAGVDRAALIAHPDAILDETQLAAFSDAAARRRNGEPIAYIVGERGFHALTLRVTPDVLIPRPETELLVDFVLENLPNGGTVLDLGTGSGAIALAVKLQRPDALVTAVDSSSAALAVAIGNAQKHGLNVEFLRGNWYEPVAMRRFDLVVSNPPYVAEGDRHLTEGDLRFEPSAALVGGPDGLAELRRICAGASGHLRSGGWLCVEHGQGQDTAVRGMFDRAGFERIGSQSDLAGIARVVVGYARGPAQG